MALERDVTLGEIEAASQGKEEVHPYLALGVSYRYEDHQPQGLVVMHYASADDVQADLENRCEFLILRVSPLDGMPRRSFDVVYARDMLFVICP